MLTDFYQTSMFTESMREMTFAGKSQGKISQISNKPSGDLHLLPSFKKPRLTVPIRLFQPNPAISPKKTAKLSESKPQALQDRNDNADSSDSISQVSSEHVNECLDELAKPMGLLDNSVTKRISQ